MDNQQQGSASNQDGGQVFSSVPRADRKTIVSEIESYCVSDVSMLVQLPTLHQHSIFDISNDDKPEATSTTLAPLYNLQAKIRLPASGRDDLPDLEWPDLTIACDTPLPSASGWNLGLVSDLSDNTLHQ